MTDNISDWRAECEAMRVQELGTMNPVERACFAWCAALHRDAMLAPWPPELRAEAQELAAEFTWLLDAAVTLQEIADAR